MPTPAGPDPVPRGLHSGRRTGLEYYLSADPPLLDPAVSTDVESGEVVAPPFDNLVRLRSIAFLSWMTRATMQELLQSDFVRTARAQGLGEGRVVLKHARASADMSSRRSTSMTSPRYTDVLYAKVDRSVSCD